MEKTYFAEKPEIFNWFAKKQGNDFFVRNIGYHNFAFAPPWNYEHTQSFHTLHFIISGKGVLLLNGKTYAIGPDSIFYIDNSSKFAYYPDPNDPWEYVFFEFDGVFAKNVLEGTGLSREQPVSKPKNPFTLKNYLHPAFLEPPSYAYAVSAFFYTIDQLSLGGRADIKKNTRREFVDNIKSYIQVKFFDPDFSVDSLSKSLFISHSHMCRIFKQYEKITVINYIKNTRLNNAASLLATTNHTLKNVALMSGFKEYEYFFRAFKKHFGETPTEYRERMGTEKRS